MRDTTPYLEHQRQSDALIVSLKRDWTFAHVPELDEALSSLPSEPFRRVTFQCGGLQSFDLAGAWVLFRESQRLDAAGRETTFTGFKAAHFKFLKNIAEIRDAGATSRRAGGGTDNAIGLTLDRLGRAVVSRVEDIGRITLAIVDGVAHPSRLGLREAVRQTDHALVHAVPIVALIAFLMGTVLAYQSAIQLEDFGAQLLVVDVVTVMMLREMGALLAGVMVAGRSGSAFAAAIGVMKLNEEIDALRVMGLNPGRILVTPRVIALQVALPILTVVGMIAGIAGGMLLSALVLEIPVVQYVERARDSATLLDFCVGLSKAPVFALLIAGVGALRGMQVSSSADQLGRLTTAAVVQGIFLIILADALFTVVFSRLAI